MARAFVVLNDGETFTDIDGCKIVILSDEEDERVGETGQIKGANAIAIINLSEMF